MNDLKFLVLGALTLLWVDFAFAKAPSIDYQWVDFAGSQQECVTTARQSLSCSGLTITSTGARAIVVLQGNYKGVISCFADHGLAVFTVAGPNKKAEQLAKRIKALFSSVPDGTYPQASMCLLKHRDLAPLSKSQLKVMRNEIYARHGFIFKNAAMKKHFNAQPWYKEKYKKVSQLITPIELSNSDLIKRYEK